MGVYRSAIMTVAVTGLTACQTGGSLQTAESFTMLPEYVQQERWECAGAFEHPSFGEADYCIIIKDGPVNGQISILAYETQANGEWGDRVGINAPRTEMPINLRYLTSGNAVNVVCDPANACTASRGSSLGAFGTIFMQRGNLMAAIGNDDGTCEVIPGASDFGSDAFHGNTGFFRGNGSRVIRDGQSMTVSGFGEVRCNAGRVTVS